MFVLTIPMLFLGLIILTIYYHVKSKDTKLSEDERKSYKIDRNISLGCTIHSAGSIYKNTKECVRDIQRDACKKKWCSDGEF